MKKSELKKKIKEIYNEMVSNQPQPSPSPSRPQPGIAPDTEPSTPPKRRTLKPGQAPKTRPKAEIHENEKLMLSKIIKRYKTGK
jgi:hypothetical protein